MKRFGFGLLAAGMLAAATLVTSLPAFARGGGGGMIWIPPMGGGMGGGGMGGGIGEWHGGGPAMRPPGGGWNRPAYNNHYRPPGGINGNPGKPHWNKNWNRNWYRNGNWYGPRYRYRYPGYNYYYGGFWYPWPWWSNVWNFEIGDNYGYYGGGYRNVGSRHVAWCQGRYRSYNVRTNTYTGYDGRQHRCNSPYD